MTNLLDDDGDLIIPDEDDLEVLPDEDDDPFGSVEGLDEERPIDDTDFDLDGELPAEDI